jgi:protein-S-isoprenylcysteine O-methyltransferase Ste14
MKTIRHTAINVLLALVWACFVYQNLSAYLQTYKLTLLLFVLVQSEFIVFLLLRNEAVRVSKASWEYAVAILGTFAALFFQPVVSGAAVPYVGDVLIYIAVALELAGFLSLNKSAGIVPANRGIRTGGLYKYVRHPIYASYIFLYAGYGINNPSSYNMTVLAAALVLQVVRLFREEKLLMGDQAYRKYCDMVRWRLIPGIF